MNKEQTLLLFSLAGFYHSNHGLDKEQSAILEKVYQESTPELQTELNKQIHWTMKKDMNWLKED